MSRPYVNGSFAQQGRQRRKNRIILLVALLAVLCLVGVIAAAIASQGESDPVESETLSSSSTQPPTGLAVAPPEGELTVPLPEDHTITPPATKASEPAKGTVEGSTAAKTDNSFFQDAVFIGDSRTEGLGNSGLMGSATFYAYKGLMVDTVFTKQVVNDGGQKLTVIDALKKHKFGKIYIMLGVNELGWASEDVFIKRYGKLVDEIKKIEPSSKIYVQSILPVSKAKSDKGVYTNDRIRLYNRLIKEMCAEKGVKYLDVYQAVVNSSGALPDDAAVDGVHLKMAYCKKWANYLRAHTA